MEKDKFKIYKLVYNDEIIYIGRTKTTLKKRKQKKYDYIPNDIQINSDIILIEETEDISRERYWIEYYLEKGKKLYNKNLGDTGLSKKEYKNYTRKKYGRKEDRVLEGRKYYLKNREKKIKYQKEQYLKNREKKIEYQKEYYLKTKKLKNKNTSYQLNIFDNL